MAQSVIQDSLGRSRSPDQSRGLRPPWQPGQGGNQGQRPNGYRRVLASARKASPEAMEKAISCMRDDTAPWPSRLKAIEMILDRAWGAPDQRFHLDGTEGMNVMIVTGVPRSDEQVTDATNAVADETTYTIDLDAEEEAP